MSKVGIGIIGCGTIADVYMTNITQHYNNVELLAVADLYIEKAQQAAEKFNVPRACSVDELLAMDEIKIVLNLTIPAASSKSSRLSSGLPLKILSICPCPIIEYPSFPIPVS